MGFGTLDNAYHASREPIKGFSRHKLNGTHKFKRDEHFIYLRQYDPNQSAEASDPRQAVPGRRSAAERAQWEVAERLRRNSAMIPPSSDAHIKRRIRRVSIAAACGVSLIFAAATSIGIYW
ncbi:HLA class II histocompatibility DQ beta 1 chain-like isoform X1 [Babesia caballi]|uniref:HLA class II histocompatibility DQ beta 1 chain-like isoform X1 n=1 Tax=Babesia caballi TaxID=5871 RepID=A0AAV4LZE3_BABCB|nr:HLA class II histocompatibility DQ beta 1 chain-like isoform X1 [Babesia caballi]